MKVILVHDGFVVSVVEVLAAKQSFLVSLTEIINRSMQKLQMTFEVMRLSL